MECIEESCDRAARSRQLCDRCRNRWVRAGKELPTRTKDGPDITGLRVGQLTVLYRTSAGSFSHQRWMCKCDCGCETPRYRNDLLRKDSRQVKTCGCSEHHRGPDHSGWGGFGEISSTFWSATKFNARAKDREFSISIEEAWRLFLDQDRKCALTGWDLTMGVDASLDRIDSSKGYISSNIQWLHKDVNRMKSNFEEDRFVVICSAVSKHKE